MKPWALIFASFLAATAGAAASPRTPILLDTDIGTDIDDAFALALIIESPEFDLVGVTTVSGDTQARARLAGKILWTAGGKWRQVPVVAGEPGPPQPIDQTRWAQGFESPQFLKQAATEFMKQEIERHPGELTLVAIGELTNIAGLLKIDPTAAKRIKRIVLMGGSIARGYGQDQQAAAEWNIR